MEKSMSVEEKIRRAEEIYAKRHEQEPRYMATVNVNGKKNIRLFKKMFIQIIVCLCIYLIISVIQRENYVFSEDFMNKTRQLLTYDIDFKEVYSTINNWFEQIIKKQNSYEEEIDTQENNDNEQQNEEVNQQEEGIGGSDEVVTLTQAEQDVIDVKNTTSFIKPVEGVISSKYGLRNPTTATVPKNHTGTDIAADLETKIKSSTDGEVILVSSEGDYGNHLKIQIGNVIIIYAHCNKIYVNEGDKIIQGQEIAEVGSTGNSTGPHLHFEIRISERTVDPQLILEL